jgi:hypothetical protein
MTYWSFWVAIGAITAFVYLFYGWGFWVASRRRPAVYASRQELEERAGTRPLSSVQTADCFWVSGIKAANAGEEWAKVKRLILPNPDAVSIKRLNEARPGGSSIPEDIRTTTRDAKKFNVSVRWYPDFIGASWWIGNPGKGNAFVHIEVVFPFTMRERRPGIRIYRWQNETFYEEHCRTFDAMWDAAVEPTEEQLNGHGKVPKPRRGQKA